MTLEELFLSKTIVIRLLLISLIFIPVSAQAEEPLKSLTLDQAFDIAASNNPQVRSAQARLGVSQAGIITAGARLNPSLMSDNGIAEKTYRIGVEKTFELGGKRRHRVAVAEAQRDVILAEINTVLLDIRANVRRAYTQLYNLQERDKSFHALLESNLELLKVAQKREQAGDIARVDTLQAEIIALNTRNDAETIHYQIIQARNTLNTLLNQPLGVVVQLAPPEIFPQGVFGLIQTDTSNTPQSTQGNVSQLDANPENLVQTALSQRPEIHQNLRELEVVRRQLQLAKANRTPNLTLAAGPDIVTGEGGATNAFITGNLELPILNRQLGPIQEALARQTQLELEQAALRNRITIEITNAYTNFLLNRDRVNRYETQILPVSEEVVQKSQRAFEMGKASILIPINAQQALRQTQLGYQQALLDYQNAISDLERALGGTL